MKQVTRQHVKRFDKKNLTIGQAFGFRLVEWIKMTSDDRLLELELTDLKNLKKILNNIEKCSKKKKILKLVYIFILSWEMQIL